LEDLFDGRPGGRRSTRHERWTITSTLFTARDARPNEKETFSLKFLGSTNRIGIVRISAIYNDIAFVEVRYE